MSVANDELNVGLDDETLDQARQVYQRVNRALSAVDAFQSSKAAEAAGYKPDPEALDGLRRLADDLAAPGWQDRDEFLTRIQESLPNFAAIRDGLDPLWDPQSDKLKKTISEATFAAANLPMPAHPARKVTTKSAPMSSSAKSDPKEPPEDVAAGDGLFDPGKGALSLSDVLAHKRGRGQALSGTLRIWLQWAGFLAIARGRQRARADGEGEVHVVTPDLVWLAMMAGRRNEAVRSKDGSSAQPFPTMYEALIALRIKELPEGRLSADISTAMEELSQYGGAAKKLQPDLLEKADPPVYLPAETVSLLRRADQVRGNTAPGESRIDARHLAAACLSSPEARKAFHELAADQTADIWKALSAAVETQIVDQLWVREDEAAWRRQFDAAEALDAPGGVRTNGALVPRYSTDKPWLDEKDRLKPDPLGVVEDARAMADLILLEKPGPPLAIGLFGDWGSGKSTFMEILEKAIDETRAKAASAREQAAEGLIERPLPFVENVAHVRFNAWHYAEADLWASLAAHIFRTLFELARKDDKSGKPSWLSLDKFKALLSDLDGAEEQVAEAAAELETRRAQVKRLGVEQAQAELRRDLLLRAAGGDRDALFRLVEKPDNAEELDGLLTGLGLPPVSSDVRQFVKTVETARSGWGRFRTALHETWSRHGLRVFAFVAAPSIAATAALALVGPAFATGAGAIGAVAAAILPFADGFKRTATGIARLAVAADGLEEAAEALKGRASEQAEAAEAERRAAERARQTAEAQLERAEKRRAGLEALASSENPQAALEAFIDARVGDDGYREHLGLISRLHEDFRSLSRLLLENEGQRDATDAPESMQRIVLYIDDLDRCNDATVTRVLEAVHLLLALPLFVVVVGVDARWLKGALERRYEAQLKAGEVWPEDYLEKIFQLPYWLRPLDTSEDGSYHNLLVELAGLRRAPSDRLRPSPGGADLSDEEAGSTEDAGAGKSGRGVSALALKPLEETEIEAIREQVELTLDEINTIDALGPLIAKSPRATKRFMNLYRFEKARRMQESAAKFLGDGADDPEFPAVMIAIAMEVGLSARDHALAVTALMESGSWPALHRLVEGLAKRTPYYDQFLKDYRGLAGLLTKEPAHDPDPSVDLDVIIPAERQLFARLDLALSPLHPEDGDYDFVRTYLRLAERGRLPRLSFKRPHTV